MAEHLRTQAGPWIGALTESSVTIRASILKGVTSARVIVAENEALTLRPRTFPMSSVWVDPEGDYRHKVATFAPHGLTPDTPYHFRLELDGSTSKALPGRFRTAPRVGDAAGFKFALAGCANPGLLNRDRTEAYRAIMDAPDLLFFFHLGDFHYENIDDEAVSPRLEAYDDTLRREPIGDLFRQLPIAYCWDDHDFLGDNSEGADPQHDRARRFARDAYDVYVPHYPFASSSDGIYQSFQIGRVLFLLTDCRYAKSPRKGSSASVKTVLGINQKAWIKQQLIAGKDLDLIVWASSIPWIGEAKAGEDFWAGYSEERKELAEHLRIHSIRNVCMISADAHMVAIDDGSNSGYGEGGRAGFPVFQAAALESSGSEKGGPYSMGDEGGGPGAGIGDRRQFGVCEIVYDTPSSPRVVWTAFRADRDTAAPIQLLRHEFPGRQTFARF
jgi:phosphodiesterase/alkaline phosphatase D-like protein